MDQKMTQKAVMQYVHLKNKGKQDEVQSTQYKHDSGRKEYNLVQQSHIGDQNSSTDRPLRHIPTKESATQVQLESERTI